jgi:hypothetical protein
MRPDDAHPDERCRQRGLVSLDTMVSSGFLLIALVAVFDFGRMYYFQTRLTQAVDRVGAFAASGNTLDDPLSPDGRLSRTESISAMIRELSGLEDLASADVDVRYIGHAGVLMSGAGGPGDIVTVSASYRFGLFAPYVAILFDDGVCELTATTAFRNDWISQAS